MKVGSKVTLITFNGKLSPPTGCDSSEDYWALIGSSGTIAKLENKRGRFLVQFDTDVSKLGLHCHNEIPNSLLILSSDLDEL
ncbi:hypothetical protein [Agarivorans sp. Alg241-V36]|uniref:hypothetical protein n=1 Tax=Agarivorans sp. Alg241-V36 TaxID=2305992 RepID=UPI0013D79F7F|nr:hypothetical protein [Agarivorans sp. Alg241-V36]